MANYLEFDLVNQRCNSVPFTSTGGDANTNKGIQTDSNGLIDASLLPWTHRNDKYQYNYGFFAKTDFSMGDVYGRFFSTVNNSNGNNTITAVDPSSSGMNGCYAYLTLSTGSSAVGAVQARGGQSFQLAPSFASYGVGFRLKMSALSTSNDEYSVQVGVQDSTTATNTLSGKNGILFHYDRATYGNDKWHTVTRLANDSYTATEISINASTSFQEFYIQVVYESSANKVKFWMVVNSEWSLIATHTANIPTGVGLHPRLAIIKSMGANARAVHLDFMYHKMEFLTPQTRTV